jgi:hypothetical protein
MPASLPEPRDNSVFDVILASTEGEVTEIFQHIIWDNWTSGEEINAEKIQLTDAGKQLTYLRWLRDVTLP